MIRKLATFVIAVALLVLTTAGPCLACSLPNTVTAPAGSCCHHGSCDKPAKVPPRDCVSPDLSMLVVDRAWSQVAPAAAAMLFPATLLHAMTLAPQPATIVPSVDAYSPPDLCLLNSVFLV